MRPPACLTTHPAGHKEALEEVQRQATAKGALKAVAVAVSGAFHTSLMQPAREALEAVLASVAISEPRIPIYSNVTGEPFQGGAHIQAMLPRQLVEAVQWEGTVRKLVAAGELHGGAPDIPARAGTASS